MVAWGTDVTTESTRKLDGRAGRATLDRQAGMQCRREATVQLASQVPAAVRGGRPALRLYPSRRAHPLVRGGIGRVSHDELGRSPVAPQPAGLYHSRFFGRYTVLPPSDGAHAHG